MQLRFLLACFTLTITSSAQGQVPEGVSQSEWASVRLLYELDRSERSQQAVNAVVEDAYIKASNTGLDDRFGSAVAISGDTMVVGAMGEDSAATMVDGDQTIGGASDSGAAYVFVRTNGVWSQQAYLKASNGKKFMFFGDALAISGDTIVVGVNAESSDATGVNGDQNNSNAGLSGAAYVFVRNGTTWSQQAYLKASNTGAGDQFGLSVDISGETIVVGSYLEDSSATGVNGEQENNDSLNSGAAYVFVRNDTTWTQEAYLKATNAEVDDGFGHSVAIDGNTLVVGATYEDNLATGVNSRNGNGAANSGAAYIFERIGSTWSQQAYLKASNTDIDDWFGEFVAVSGDTVAVAAQREDSRATGIDGDQANDGLPSAGAVYVFTRTGTEWNQQAYIKASNTDQSDLFGRALAISGDNLAVGTYRESSASTGIGGDQSDNSAPLAGAVYQFARFGTKWVQTAYVKAPNAEEDDWYGSSVALDGTTLLVGAPFERSASTGLGGDQSDNSLPFAGAAYLQDLRPPSLFVEESAISLSNGGSQFLLLNGGQQRANWFYFMFGSATGTAPGLNLGGGLVLPLNFDAYSNLTLTKPGLAIFENFRGQLNAAGRAVARITLPTLLDPSLVGVTLNHAYLAGGVLGITEYVSVASPVVLVP